MTAPVTWQPDAAGALKRIAGRLFATTTECAVILGYDVRTVRKGIEEETIPAVRVGTTYRIPVAWIRQQARVGTGGGNAA